MNATVVVTGEVRARLRCMEGFWEKTAGMDRDQTWWDHAMGAADEDADASRTGRQ